RRPADDPSDESHDLDQEHELSRTRIRALVACLYEAACGTLGGPPTVAKGRLVTECDGDGRWKAAGTHGAGLRAVAREPRAIPREAHRARRHFAKPPEEPSPCARARRRRKRPSVARSGSAPRPSSLEEWGEKGGDSVDRCGRG